jgi:predicted acyl esterase
LTVAAAIAALAAVAMAPASAGAAVNAGGSVNQVYVTGANPGEKLRLLDRKGKRVSVKAVSSLGAAIFRRIDAGKDYRVKEADGTLSVPVDVMNARNAPPKNTQIYNQTIPANGYGYLTTRDGTKLAISVRLPSSGSPPYPTLVEYSGYGYANPAGAQSGISPILQELGYAVVDVNMRGTGCSGGAYDFFERLQGLDGYDVIETVARQPWVMHNKVGMAGLSFGGISQLFVGATRPPSLSAITPLSVIDNTATTLYPGGILNTGFALEWAEDRADDAKPATATDGQGWAYNRIQNGDTTCAENQILHSAAPNLLAKVRNNRYYRPKVANPLNPSKFVHKIRTPVFLACQFNDEQTGAHCPNLADRFDGTKKKWFTFTNGLHVDALDPETFNRWFDFLELYVAQRKPNLPPSVQAQAPVVYQAVMGVSGVTLPPDPIRNQPTFEAAKAAFEAQPRVRILFDNGAGSIPGRPVPTFEQTFKDLPVPSAKPRIWFLGENGSLRGKPEDKPGSDTFLWDKEARGADNFIGTNTGSGDLWTAKPSYDWRHPPEGTAATYVTKPLAADNRIIGAGALHAWIKANVPDVDLQVTISEIRPDGKEVYVQSGWLRTSLRALDKKRSSILEPVLSMRKGDAARLPKGEFEKIVVPLYYQGHYYRAGSRIRVDITAPSGDQPVWSFAETVPVGDANVTVHFSPDRHSKLILPKVPGELAPRGLPPCPSLRGEPCR